MKITTLIVAASLSLLAIPGAQAAQKSPKASTPQTPAVQPVKKSHAKARQQDQAVALTGSYIKRPIKRHGLITNGPNPVYVIDSKSIEVTGASDLSQVLLRQGFRR